MSLLRIALASIAGFITYFVLGGLTFAIFPSFRDELAKLPAIYRNQQGQVSHMAIGIPAMFL
jgi:hypothetical protein